MNLYLCYHSRNSDFKALGAIMAPLLAPVNFKTCLLHTPLLNLSDESKHDSISIIPEINGSVIHTK